MEEATEAAEELTEAIVSTRAQALEMAHDMGQLGQETGDFAQRARDAEAATEVLSGVFEIFTRKRQDNRRGHRAAIRRHNGRNTGHDRPVSPECREYYH